MLIKMEKFLLKLHYHKWENIIFLNKLINYAEPFLKTSLFPSYGRRIINPWDQATRAYKSCCCCGYIKTYKCSDAGRWDVDSDRVSRQIRHLGSEHRRSVCDNCVGDLHSRVTRNGNAIGHCQHWRHWRCSNWRALELDHGLRPLGCHQLRMDCGWRWDFLPISQNLNF